jgi:hypothetical protein
VTTVIVSSFDVANFPEGGGHFWVYLQYVQALRQAGCDVYWMELFNPPVRHPKAGERALDTFFERARAFGLEDRLLPYKGNGEGGPRQWFGPSAADAEATLRRADLLLNFHYAIDPSLLALPKRTALVDIDPGLLQMWMGNGQLSVPAHDVYLTTGETVGSPDAPFPDCGVDWIHFVPPVCLDLWPSAYDPASHAFTTVTTWWSDSWITVPERGWDVVYENTKRISFLEFADLPSHTTQPLELAVYFADSDLEERRLLETNGWHVRHSRDVAASPEAYRSYIQHSRGEFSCAKPSCMRFQNAWVSDRTLCYLASGKPVVVQHTGPSAFLPNGEGMFRFKTIAEAAQALETINADYERQCHAARAIAETHFDSKKVADHILNAALG